MINVAIDGPSGSGKSTVADIISERLDILHLDTGAMYRACGLKAKLSGISCENEAAVNELIENIDLKIFYENGVQLTFLDGRDVSREIRMNDISRWASDISALPCVREKMVKMQRAVAKENSCVLDGRDICLHVLPNAKYKFFMTATAEIRAERRVKELVERGQSADYSVILREINERDYNDSHRAFSPLVQAPDAVLIDTTNLSREQAADVIEKAVLAGEGRV